MLIISHAWAATPIQNGYFLNLNTIKFVKCVTAGHGEIFAGTAFIIGKGRVVTADHVIYEAQSCTIDQKKVSLISHSAELDFAVLGVDLGDKPPILEVSCDGLILGNQYYAVGFSKAQDFAMTKLIAQGSFEGMNGEGGKDVEHLSRMKGLVFPGMSGGPIIDMDGRVVGLINASDQDGNALGRSLSETALCAALAAPDAPLYPMPPKKEINFDDILSLLPGHPKIIPIIPPAPKK
jgi:S1-C subfamily serine protease